MRCNVHELKVENLVKTIKQHEIVRGISMELKTGEVVGLLGPNGAGKTTTFYMICGLIEATGGKVFIDGTDVSDLPLHQRSRMGIGYLPQEASIFKDLTVEENLIIAAQAGKLDAKMQEQRIEELLEMFNIEPIRNRRGINLSGGERRRGGARRSAGWRPSPAAPVQVLRRRSCLTVHRRQWRASSRRLRRCWARPSAVLPKLQMTAAQS